MKPAARVTESARHRSGSGVPPPSAPARTTLTLIAITSGIRHPASGIRQVFHTGRSLATLQGLVHKPVMFVLCGRTIT